MHRGGAEDEVESLRRRVEELEAANEALRARLAEFDPSIGAGGEHDTEVDLGGLMTVLSRHLYSTPLVAVRELVQNAHDSIVRRRRFDAAAPDGLVEVDLVDGSLVVADNGEGMTSDQVRAALGVVGSGVTGEVRRVSGDEDLIGQFGVGFLSAFVLGDEVTVHTMSVDSDRCVRYRSSDGLAYTLELCDLTDGAAHRREPGTTVIARLDEGGRTLTDSGALRQALSRYCALLRVSIELDGERVNLDPPWRRFFDDPVAARSAAVDFVAGFEQGEEPLAVIALHSDASSDVNGLLWVRSRGSYATTDRRNLSVYVRGMLLDSDAKDLLPEWAGFIGGVVESVDLVPTASREDIQRTPEFSSAVVSIRRQLVEGLRRIATEDAPAWRRIVARHNDQLRGAAVSDDEVFGLVGDLIEVPTSDGDLRPSELLARSDGRIHLSFESGSGFEEILYRCLGVPVAHGQRFGVATFLRRWCDQHAVPLVEVGHDGDGGRFFPADVSPRTIDWFAGHLTSSGERLVACRFEPVGLPLLVRVDRDAELKRILEDDDADRLMSSAALGLARAHTAEAEDRETVEVRLNMDSPIVAALAAAVESGRVGVDGAGAVLRSIKAMLSTGRVATPPAASVRGSGVGERPADDLMTAIDHLGALGLSLIDGGAEGGT